MSCLLLPLYWLLQLVNFLWQKLQIFSLLMAGWAKYSQGSCTPVSFVSWFQLPMLELLASFHLLAQRWEDARQPSIPGTGTTPQPLLPPVRVPWHARGECLAHQGREAVTETGHKWQHVETQNGAHWATSGLAGDPCPTKCRWSLQILTLEMPQNM